MRTSSAYSIRCYANTKRKAKTGTNSNIIRYWCRRHDSIRRIRKETPCKERKAATVFATDGKAKIQFKLPELSSTKIIEHEVHITKQKSVYDMVMGQDILKALGIDIRFSDMTVAWENVTIPMKSQPADLTKIVEGCIHLSTQERKELYTLLKEYEDLFDGTLGHWNLSDYNINPKLDAKPYQWP